MALTKSCTLGKVSLAVATRARRQTLTEGVHMPEGLTQGMVLGRGSDSHVHQLVWEVL